MNSFEFITARRFVCEPGAVDRLSTFCEETGIRRPMLVTDPGIAATGMIDPVVTTLNEARLRPRVYSDVQADPPEALVLAAVEAARVAEVDGVIGFGGGSSMDVAKLIAVMANSEQPIADMYGIGKVHGERLPLIQIPTTAGTGSEVTATSIITTGETTKAGIISPQLLPDLALLDARLTLGLPPAVTAATGIDAMVHAIEAYTSKVRKNLYSDVLARQALQLMSTNIVEAVRDGSNESAREAMLLGAMMAGQAFANAPVAAVHALAYPLGGHYHIPHGLSNSLVLPHVLRFNANSAAALYAELGPCVGTNADCGAFVAAMDSLIDQVALPKTLREMNVAETDLPMLADDAMLQTRLLVNNPREVTRDDALQIYRAAY